VNVQKEIPEAVIMIAGSRCAGLWVNGLSGCETCVNGSKEIHEAVVMIVAAMIEAKICVKFGKSA